MIAAGGFGLRRSHEENTRASDGVTQSGRRTIDASLGGGIALAASVTFGASAGLAPAPNLRDPALVAQGERLYLQHCASCHGVELEGQPGWQRPLPDGGLPAPPHDPDGHTWHHSDRLLFEITKFGGQALAPPEFKSNMPAFGQTLSDAEIWAVLAFIKSRWPEEIRARQAEITRADP
jgi:mono/diheme cytochrome c family protein